MRLEEAVARLVDVQARLIDERRELRRALEVRDQRIRLLEESVLQHNQTKRDVAKRIDDLIARLDRIETASGDSPT